MQFKKKIWVEDFRLKLQKKKIDEFNFGWIKKSELSNK